MKRTAVLLSVGALLVAFTAAVRLGAWSDGDPPIPTPPPTGGGGARASLDLDGVLSVVASLESTHALSGAELALDLDVTAGRPPREERVPVDVVMVLDRSGSMQGDKIEHARAAARGLLGMLRPGDRVALVSYATDVVVHCGLVDASGAPALGHAVDGLVADGSTNLDGGLSRAIELLSPEARSGRAQRVILISDGEANVGRSTLEALGPMVAGAAERGVTLSSVGVGLAFNEHLMMGLADRGVGNFHYVRDGAELAGVFANELETLAATVARSATIEVEPAPGVTVVDVIGHTFERVGGGVRIPVGDFFPGARRKVLLRLQLAKGVLGPADAATVRASVVDARHGRRVSATAELGVVLTDRVADVDRGRDPEVTAAIGEVRASEAMSNAMRMFEHGDTAGASTLLQSVARSLRAEAAPLAAPVQARMRESAEQLDRADGAVVAAPSASSDAGRDAILTGRAGARALAQ